MRATITTKFNSPADTVWRRLPKKETFLYITRYFLGFTGSKTWPEKFYEGLEFTTRLVGGHIIPLWRHKIKVVRVDNEKRELFSNEGGGLIPVWDHLITVKPVNGNECQYADIVDIGAGLLTPVIWVYAHIFYRYRQARWKRLIKKQS
jgi:hypothetical protein